MDARENRKHQCKARYRRAAGFGAGRKGDGGRIHALAELAVVDSRDGTVVTERAGTLAGGRGIANGIRAVISVCVCEFKIAI